jgi:hypothetical protein
VSDPVLVVLVVLATMRVTRLVTTDYLTEPPRRWVQRHAPEKLAYLVGCPWCASVWTGAALALLAVRWPTWWVVALLLGLASSQVTGLLARLDPPEDFGVTADETADE